MLLADIVAGFIEDPLLAVAGLGLSPRLVPEAVREALAMPLEDGVRRGLSGLNSLLSRQRDVKEFVAGFRRGLPAVRAPVRGQSTASATLTRWRRSAFGELRSLLKDGFLRRVLFPYNNEKVAHGSLLTEELVKPSARCARRAAATAC